MAAAVAAGDVMRHNPWTKERLELLRTLWAAGVTANAIGVVLGGVTRSAVLGKVFRLRLGVPPAAAERAGGSALSGTESPASAASRDTGPLPTRRRAARRTAFPDNSHAAPRPRGRSLLELTNETCRWVVEAAVKWLLGLVLSHVH